MNGLGSNIYKGLVCGDHVRETGSQPLVVGKQAMMRPLRWVYVRILVGPMEHTEEYALALFLCAACSQNKGCT